jgi:hypothetical protein
MLHLLGLQTGCIILPLPETSFAVTEGTCGLRPEMPSMNRITHTEYKQIYTSIHVETEVSTKQNSQNEKAGWTIRRNFKRQNTELTASVTTNFVFFLPHYNYRYGNKSHSGQDVNIAPPFPVAVNTFRSPGLTSNEPCRNSGKLLGINTMTL